MRADAGRRRPEEEGQTQAKCRPRAGQQQAGAGEMQAKIRPMQAKNRLNTVRKETGTGWMHAKKQGQAAVPNDQGQG
jgi:hypothetical protein